MNKKTTKITEKVLLGFAIGSVIITFIEGLLYYNAGAYPNVLIRYMLVFQNTIRAFAFKSDIGIKDVEEMLQVSTSIVEMVIHYVYLLAIFIAPYCTLSFIYKVLEKIFRLRRKHQFKNHKGIIIFGFNEEVKSLLADYQKVLKSDSEEDIKKKRALKEYRIHLVADNVTNEDEMQLLKDSIVVHKVDCLKLSEKQLKYFFGQMKSNMAKHIILFEESSARNFSLYKMFHDEKDIVTLNEDVKFFCRCENEGIKALMEDFHDNDSDFDMETISIPELRIRKTLELTPLHTYYLSKPDTLVKDWNLHLLIIGFGKLGQQMLLQAMNQGVVSSTNRILVDVVDFDIEKKSSVFANTFNENYVHIEDDRMVISSDKADGECKIRFHQMDITYKKFFSTLKTYGDNEHGGMYTYAAICIEDEEVGIHCLAEVQRYLREYAQSQDADNVPVAIRMEMDKYMKKYLNDNQKTFKNVNAIEESREVITLEELLHDTLDTDAKEYNRIYNRIQISDVKDVDNSSQDEVEDIDADRKALWYKLKLFRRDSNRALAQHAKIKEAVWEIWMKNNNPTELINHWFGQDGVILKHRGNAWVYEDGLDDFVEKQSNQKEYPYVSEMSRLEHRRWCYFMASRGWRSVDAADKGKERAQLDKEKKNACLCTWDDLVKVKKDTCPYDLMWLLKKCN